MNDYLRINSIRPLLGRVLSPREANKKWKLFLLYKWQKKITIPIHPTNDDIIIKPQEIYLLTQYCCKYIFFILSSNISERIFMSPSLKISASNIFVLFLSQFHQCFRRSTPNIFVLFLSHFHQYFRIFFFQDLMIHISHHNQQCISS